MDPHKNRRSASETLSPAGSFHAAEAPAPSHRSLLQWLDRRLGRGTYPWLRKRLDPQIQYSQFVYAELLKTLVTSETRWLDAGGGHQVLEVRLREAEKAMVNHAALAVGCDLMVQSIERHRSLCNLAVCALERLPFRSGSFSLITLNMVAEHLERPAAVLAELARVVVPHGIIVIHTPNAVAYQVRLARLVWRVMAEAWVHRLILFFEHREPEDVFPAFYRANSRDQLRRLTSGAGFAERQAQWIFERPILFFFAPLSAFEMVTGRLFRRLGLGEFCASTILAVYQKANGSPGSTAGQAIAEADSIG